MLPRAFDNEADMDNPAGRFVDEELPNKYRLLIPAALRRAYALADETIEALERIERHLRDHDDD